jgi:hypothetical protein
MRLYDFEVLQDSAVIALEQAVVLADPRAAWREVARLAKSHDRRGCKIRVKDESGRIVILTGVASVLRHAHELAA